MLSTNVQFLSSCYLSRDGTHSEIQRVNKLPQVKVFSLPSKYNMADMLRADIDIARDNWLGEVEYNSVEYEARSKSDFLKGKRDSGNIDFHCLRHSFGSMLAASGVHPKVAQELMRHGDINLTMSRYTHTLRGQTAKAIESLPDLTKSARAEKAAMTGTDNQIVDCISEIKQIKPDTRLAIYLAKSGIENQNKPESTGLLVQKDVNAKNCILSHHTGFSGEKQEKKRMGALGLEPRTYALKGRCSTN